MLFIDGSHNYYQVLRDLKGWGSLVKVGGYIALHDMWFPSVSGVAKAVARWWDGKKWLYRGQVDFTIAFERRR
jgi:cephalosporin hydroxylase